MAEEPKDTSLKERVGNGILGMSFIDEEGKHIGQCLNCKWYNGNQKCDGFPGGIPEAIFKDAMSHEEEVPGDNGFVFDPKIFGG